VPTILPKAHLEKDVLSFLSLQCKQSGLFASVRLNKHHQRLLHVLYTYIAHTSSLLDLVWRLSPVLNRLPSSAEGSPARLPLAAGEIKAPVMQALSETVNITKPFPQLIVPWEAEFGNVA
jgi:hypothetical protein